jgi:hypothetical protein
LRKRLELREKEGVGKMWRRKWDERRFWIRNSPSRKKIIGEREEGEKKKREIRLVP